MSKKEEILNSPEAKEALETGQVGERLQQDVLDYVTEMLNADESFKTLIASRFEGIPQTSIELAENFLCCMTRDGPPVIVLTIPTKENVKHVWMPAPSFANLILQLVEFCRAQKIKIEGVTDVH